MNKKDLRSKYKNLKISNINFRSSEAILKIKENTIYRSAKTILAYIPLSGEVDISELITTNKQKKIFIASIDFIVSEPIDLALIPGVAFDKYNYRLGRGLGWYDKLLKQNPHIYKIGICYKEQLIDKLPTEDHDIKMDEVIYC